MFWEDYSPLRELTTNTLAKAAHLFPVKDALLFIEKKSRWAKFRTCFLYLSKS